MTKKNKKTENPNNVKDKKSVGIMKVELFDDGSVQVRDFPNSPAPAIQILGAAIIEMAMYFIKKANMVAQLENQSRIIKAGQGSIDLVNQSKKFKDGLKI